MSVIFSNCMECGHFPKVDENGKCICDAFPNGIPLNYMFRKEQNKKDECNNGIKFKAE